MSDEHKIPVIVERLIVAIETHGMFTVGVYRKSGATAKVKQLKQNIDSGKEGQYPTLAALDCLRVKLFENDAQSGWSVPAWSFGQLNKKLVCLPSQDPMTKKYLTQWRKSTWLKIFHLNLGHDFFKWKLCFEHDFF